MDKTIILTYILCKIYTYLYSTSKDIFLEKYKHEQVLIFSISIRFILLVMMNKDYSLAHIHVVLHI